MEQEIVDAQKKIALLKTLNDNADKNMKSWDDLYNLLQHLLYAGLRKNDAHSITMAMVYANGFFMAIRELPKEKDPATILKKIHELVVHGECDFDLDFFRQSQEHSLSMISETDLAPNRVLN